MENNNAKKEKFIDLLHELFQLNQPELDFGLYRIMHAKSGQIKAFIENDLAREIDEAFAAGGDDKVSELKAAYEQARAQAKEFGIDDPDSNPKVREAKEAYDAARENGDDPSDIYDHLYRFFSRYYDKGDFLSRRYHVAENDSRAAPYAVPYDGREVYLHWANKDQYYIKSSEYLSNFSFDLAEALKKERQRQGVAGQAGFDFEQDATHPLKVTFQLVEAAEGAHNNVKENQSRFFIIHAEKPVELHSGEVVINFEYRDDLEKSGQDGTWQKKRLDEAEVVILETMAQESKSYHDALAFLAPTEKQRERTLLGKYLASYTARNTMDYFIHKNLGGFLRRELDFYIKNEIMRLDDLSVDDVEGVTRSLKKITALRAIARQIVDFLAQLEEFQKKLWLKKKFVTEANYCITLDRVPEDFYDEIVANERQWAQWEGLGFTVERSRQALNDNPYMMVDTGVFDEGFKGRLLADIEGLDDQCNGVLINSESYQALNFLNTTKNGGVKCVYIDPPYNIGNGDFVYKDAYQHSSWMSFVYQSLMNVAPLLADSAIIGCSIDDNEVVSLGLLMSDLYGANNKLAYAPWKAEPSGGKQKTGIRYGHEYLVIYSAGNNSNVSRDVTELGEFSYEDDMGPYIKGRELRKWGDASLREDRPGQFFELKAPDGTSVFPYRNDGREGRWRWGKDNPSIIEAQENPDVFHWDKTPFDDGVVVNGQTERWDPFEKIRETTKQSGWGTWLDGHGTNADGTKALKNLFGFKSFSTPKPPSLIKWFVNLSADVQGVVLDCFAGSGTTGQAAIDLNREDGGERKYILVEMGGYFETVLKPRIAKVIFSSEWKDGLPVKQDGISHCIKYMTLESYEDTLNNLMLDGDLRRADMLVQDGNARLRKDYLLHYFLDVETRGSVSLLNVEQFRDPTAYTLMMKKPASDAQVPVKVDLVETFNGLIGLEVALLDRPRIYAAEFEREKDPELPEDQHTRLKVIRFKEEGDGAHWFRIVEGYVRRTPGSDADRERVMVVWRKLTDDPEQDAAALEALLEKYRVNQADSEFDKIYINGPHGLSLSGQAKARLLSLEETFMARMWEGAES